MDKSRIGEIVKERFGARYGANRRKALVSMAYELSEHSVLSTHGDGRLVQGIGLNLDFVRIADSALDGAINSGAIIWEDLHRERMRALARDLTTTPDFTDAQLRHIRERVQDTTILAKIEELLGSAH